MNRCPPGFHDPVQFPAVFPEGGGIAVIDDLDGHRQVEGPGHKGQAVEVGLGQIRPCRNHRGFFQAVLEELQHLGVDIHAPDRKTGGEQRQQVTAHAAAGIQHLAAAGLLHHRDQGHQFGIGLKGLHDGIGKKFSPTWHNDLDKVNFMKTPQAESGLPRKEPLAELYSLIKVYFPRGGVNSPAPWRPHYFTLAKFSYLSPGFSDYNLSSWFPRGSDGSGVRAGEEKPGLTCRSPVQ